jgi:hypothetical protein
MLCCANMSMAWVWCRLPAGVCRFIGQRQSNNYAHLISKGGLKLHTTYTADLRKEQVRNPLQFAQCSSCFHNISRTGHTSISHYFYSSLQQLNPNFVLFVTNYGKPMSEHHRRPSNEDDPVTRLVSQSYEYRDSMTSVGECIEAIKNNVFSDCVEKEEKKSRAKS